MPMNPRLLVPRANFDPDAAAYIRAVEVADTQPLEAGVKRAIDNFVRGLKQDNLWSAIKASCILAGARTLTGALTPLRGSAPTNNGPFVSGDYARGGATPGLLGNGTSKNLSSGRLNNADPTDNKHLAVWMTAHHSRNVTRTAIGTGTGVAGDSQLLTTATARLYRINYPTGTAGNINETATTAGFWGASRSLSASVEARYNGTTTTLNDSSSAATNTEIFVFSRSASQYSDARISFYSIGESLNLALLDARLSTLMTAIGAAIP
jgi:hypothetical protein